MSASSFGASLKLFAEKVERRTEDVFTRTVGAVHASVKEGDATTGAPGQPVDTSDLINSWQETYPMKWVGRTATNAAHARAIEEGQQEPYTRADGTVVVPSPMTLRSEVGGFHSVKLTRAGYQKLVQRVAKEVVA